MEGGRTWGWGREWDGRGGGGETKDGKEKIKKKMITNKTGLKQREVEPKRSGCQPKVRWAGGGGAGGLAKNTVLLWGYQPSTQ